MPMNNGQTGPFVGNKMFAALFYASTSFMIVLINKNLLTGYRFPSFQFVGLGQIVATIIILHVGKKMNIVSFPDYSTSIILKVMPLSVIYLANLIFGLGSTQSLSIPMMTVLRRFSILMTMIGERVVLKKNPSMGVQMTVYMMLGGAIVAASDDLAFNFVGYAYVLLNDFFTAANGVMTKKKLGIGLNKYGLLYYNAVLTVLPALLLAFSTGDVERAFYFDEWYNPYFCFQFFLSSVMGFVLMYSVVLCTSVNSALTTTVVGCLKNILVTYIGMVFGGDYKFSYVNFIGVNISVVGSVFYSYIVFTEKQEIQVQINANPKETPI